MKRAELELAIVTAAQIIQQNEALVIGSQAILGSFDETVLPSAATMSQEVDIAPLRDDERESLATKIDAGAGEMSPFDVEHGFYVQGVSVSTVFCRKAGPIVLYECRHRDIQTLWGCA